MSICATFANASNDAWLSVLQRSVREPYIDGVELPRFPHSSVQLGYNGAADEEAMLRAHGFWLYAEGYGRALGAPLGAASRVLDIGCGWGRIARTFARDIPPERMHGVDIDPAAITLCKYLGVPGDYRLTKPGEPLPFPDGHFTMITASSVFTHLPEAVATQLITEMSRVSAPGGLMVFTVEDTSFLDTLESRKAEDAGGRWGPLLKYQGRAEALRRAYSEGEYIYLTTNEEEFRSSDVYGDSLIPKAWMEANWAKQVEIMALQPTRAPVYQAVVVARKR